MELRTDQRMGRGGMALTFIEGDGAGSNYVRGELRGRKRLGTRLRKDKTKQCVVEEVATRVRLVAGRMRSEETPATERGLAVPGCSRTQILTRQLCCDAVIAHCAAGCESTTAVTGRSFTSVTVTPLWRTHAVVQASNPNASMTSAEHSLAPRAEAVPGTTSRFQLAAITSTRSEIIWIFFSGFGSGSLTCPATKYV
jgi:hypothetical protein